MNNTNSFLESLPEWTKFEEAVATIAIFFALMIKLVTSSEETTLRLKKTFISIPSEISFLVCGFLLSLLSTAPNTADARGGLSVLLFTLTVIVLQCRIEHYLNDKLSGRFKFLQWFWTLFTYGISLLLYYFVVFWR